VSDIREREYWDDYMDAYEQLIQYTSHVHAPWFVVRADHKWFTCLVVAAAVIDALQGTHLAFPQVDADRRKELQTVWEMLEREGRPGRRNRKHRHRPPKQSRLQICVNSSILSSTFALIRILDPGKMTRGDRQPL